MLGSVWAGERCGGSAPPPACRPLYSKPLSGAHRRKTALIDELGQRAENGLDDRLAPVRGPRPISKRPSETSARKRSPPSQSSLLATSLPATRASNIVRKERTRESTPSAPRGREPSV